MAAAVIESEEPVTSVHIEGLAALKIVKHCQESLPQMVTGSLLGLTVGHGILEITHAFPFPDPTKKGDLVKAPGDDDTTATPAVTTPGGTPEMDGHEYQLEMMKMLREVNVDNNCVGWYQSMYLGSYSTQTLVENQWSYQTDLSPNAVVMLYDPVQTSHGRFTMRCFRLTEECMKIKADNKNAYIDPKNIFQELPVKLTNPGLVRAMLYDVAVGSYAFAPDASNMLDDDEDALDGAARNTNNRTMGGGMDCTFDNLDMSTNPYLEKHLEFLCSWVDDLSAEQQKFQYYARNLNKDAKLGGHHHRGKPRDAAAKLAAEQAAVEGWQSGDAPRRMESLLIANQIRNYCDQVDAFADGGFGKLFLASGLHKDGEDQASS